ncbi:site-specific integrase [Burkholderia ubonensis]|uniref:site-specific integrase n=1 Tax=Burkholderia ubonensis TaxID=101571 RepID=UPI00211BEE6C|nr:site-specific integrase [Burkholderia ubonensis]
MTTNDIATSPVSAPYVGALPAIATTRGGCRFHPHDEVWILRELTHEVTLRFDNLPHIGDYFKASFRSTLVWYAENASLRHLGNTYSRALRLFEHKFETTGAPVVEISSVDLLNFRAHLGKEREWYLGLMTGFFKRWHGLGYVGVTHDAHTLLNQLRLKGNPKGVATATLDPLKGPFTALEHEALLDALNDAYGRTEVTLAEYVLCWMFILLGMRPTQYAALKVCDVAVLRASNEQLSYSVRMPRAKTRQGNGRGQFKDRLLTPEIGKLVYEYARQVEEHFTGIIDNPSHAPMFPDRRAECPANADDYHLTSAELGKRLNGVLNRLNVKSVRTGQRINVSARRFRTTIGTRAAEEGHGELVIAELLDHSDTQNVGVYVRSTPAIVERIDRAVAMQLAPLAQAFAGKLINGPSEATRNGQLESQIRAPAITGKFEVMSSCGKHGFCGFLKPVACYTCNSFEPWLDGPHEQVLEYLIAERERLMAAGDARIASINDRAILAVAEVLQLCEAARDERGAAHG